MFLAEGVSSGWLAYYDVSSVFSGLWRSTTTRPYSTGFRVQVLLNIDYQSQIYGNN